MYLKTTMPVKYGESMFKDAEDVLYLNIKEVHYIDKFSKVKIDFYYEKRLIETIKHPSDGEDIEMEVPRIVYSDSMEIEATSINTLYQQVKAGIPSNLTDIQHQEYKFYLGAKLKMYEVLLRRNPNLTLSQIELVV